MQHWVAHNGESASCTNIQESPVTPGKKVSRKAPPVTVSPTASPSVRTLILGIDRTGRIVQHDRTAPKILARSSDDLLGVNLSDITATQSKDGGKPVSPDQGAILVVASLLEAIKSDREANDMLSIALADGTIASSVVSARPMQAGGSDVAALVILQIPIPSGERFIEPGLMREVLLRDSALSDEDTLDFSDLAKKMTAQLVPAFCTAAEVLVLESLIGDNEVPAHVPEADVPLRRLHVKHDKENPSWQAAFPVGEILRFPGNSPYSRCIATGEPVLEASITPEAARKLARAWRRKPVGGLLSDTSMLVLPAISKGTVVGLFCCFRELGTRRFDRYDMDMAMDFAARQAVFFDHATRYNREHATALTLQRAMLPTHLSYPSSIDVRHRYLPGSELVEVGGDWYESIRLPGARVALVVGDVAGHGVRAAVTMGRLRTAIQTLAMLELPPAATLQQLDELMQNIGEREPHFATCAYGVYDAVTGEIELAVAGHLPPLLVNPDGTNEYLEVQPSPPLGIIDDGVVETTRHQIEDGSLFVLYTDGLVESRDRDISEGLDRLQVAFGEGAPEKDLEDLCKTALDGVYSDAKRDDIAVLIAKLRRIPEDHRIELPARARALLRPAGPLDDQGPAQALGSRGPHPGHRAAGLRAGHQRDQVRPRRDAAAAHPGAGLADVRGARHLARAAPGAPGRQGRRERPRPARRLAAVGPLGRPPLAGRQGRLVRAARPPGDRGRDARRNGDRAPDFPLGC